VCEDHGQEGGMRMTKALLESRVGAVGSLAACRKTS
jgi:hypothetical protein